MTTEQNEEDKKAITDMKQYVSWWPKGVTLDGDFTVEELKVIVRFMENGGPGDAYCNHKEL